jgi:hypothetical protein
MIPEQDRLSIPPEAVWIGSEHPFDLHEVYLRFRSPDSWKPAHLPQNAELFITADSRYKVWINGQFVARGPARGYPESQTVDRLDIKEQIRPRENVLAVLVYQPGYSHFAYVHRGAAGLLAYLVCDGEVVLPTDTNWRVSRDESYSSLVPRVSIYGSGVEERDLYRAEQGRQESGRRESAWQDAGFDDSDWSEARLVAAAGGSPWTTFRRRGLPFLKERELPATLVEAGRGPHSNPDRLDPHQDLRQAWQAVEPAAIDEDERGGFTTEGWFSPRLAMGEAAYWLYDLGRDFTCQGWAEIDGAAGRERLSISYAEKMRHGRIVLPDPQNYCRVRLTDRFKLRPGSQVAETFALRGGRYLLWQLVGPTGADFRFRPHARVAEYPLTVTRPLLASDEASSELLEGIVRLCETTMRACLQDGFVDCVWRESSQWLGDALPQSLALWAMTDDFRPIKQILEMAAQGAYPDGILPSVVPGEVHAYTIVRYNFMWVELLHFYERISGDGALIDKLWPSLQKMLDAVFQYRAADNLLVNPPGRRFYIDFSPTSQNEPHAVYNLHYVLALQTAARLAEGRQESGRQESGRQESAGMKADAARWQARAHDLLARIRESFYKGGCWYDDVEGSTCSQLAAALAILTNAARLGEKASLLDAVAARSLDANDDHTPGGMVLASPFMHHYIFEALRQEKRFAAVLEIVRLRWGRWVKAGYPTTWENWNVDFPDGSQCHSFSAHPRYHLAEIARETGLLM